jgi:heme o synthase
MSFVEKTFLTVQTRLDKIQVWRLALAAAIVLFVLLVTGGMVRVAAGGGGCPDWPTCLGQWTPPTGGSAVVDYAHRFTTFLATPLLLAAAWLGWRRFQAQPWLRRALVGTVVLLVGQIFFGALLAGEGAWLAAAGIDRAWASVVHLSLSLLMLGSVLAAAMAAYFLETRQVGEAGEKNLQLRFDSPFGRYVRLVLVVLFVLLISGAVVSGANGSEACEGWPLCTPESLAGWISLGHRGVVAVAGLLMAGLLVQAWRTQRSQPAILTAATAAVVLFFSQALMGARLVAGFPAYLLALHLASAVALWGAVIILEMAVGAAGRSAQAEAQEAAEFAQRRPRRMLLDLLALTKPIVVALLLVTTYAGMVIGGEAWPNLSLVFFTLLGGFMAAGGSGAINQYIDRHDDSQMQRTQKRPIPDGRLEPAEGLAFGVGMALASFYLVAAFVNFLAALLTLAGIIYYVLLYSIFLKKTTVQNIVIGGGAGAIPPLVGWAAVTGSLNIPSLFLFAVVFMWTPPHFWALALVRRKDYARANVPMLPVVRGEKETRWQILVYTLELVGLTLLLPLFGLGGAIYLLGALVLGLWLLHAAWKVWREGGNKLAWKMYRYSSMYLAFLFFVLMIDRVL